MLDSTIDAPVGTCDGSDSTDSSRRSSRNEADALTTATEAHEDHPDDSEVRMILAAWPILPAPVRSAIVQLVRHSASRETGPTP